MRMISVFTLLAVLTLQPSPPPASADQLADTQAAVTNAEKKLQHAIDTDPRVVAARRRLEKAQATLDESLKLGESFQKVATQRYQEAIRAEQAAVDAAAPTERAALAQLQKNLLALKESPPTTAPGQNLGTTQRAEEAPLVTSQRAGDVEVRLLHVRIAPVNYTPAGSTQVRTSDPFLGVLVEVTNLGKGPVQYLGWNSDAFATDPAGKQYLPAGVPGGTVLGRVVSESLPPGASITDLIVLQRAPEKKDLTLTLPIFNLGGSGAAQFHLPADKIENDPKPLIAANASPPHVVLAHVSQPAATTKAAGPPGHASHSADGVDFPPVTDPEAKKDHARPCSRLPDVCNLLLYPPAKLNFPVFSVDKSVAKLKDPMSHVVGVPGARARGVTRAERIEQDRLDPACQFFALGIANASVAGFEIRNGVVARIVLYYNRTDTAQRMLLGSYGPAPKANVSPNTLAVEVGPWTCKNANGGNTHDPVLKRDVWPILPQESPATLEVDVTALRDYAKPAN